MTIGYVTSLRNDSLQAIIDAIGPDGDLRIYLGVRPATGGAETTVMATLPLSNVAAPAPVNGTLTFNPISDDTNVAAGGVPTWGRVRTSLAAAVMDVQVAVAWAISLRARATNVATITTADPHGYSPGDVVDVEGVGGGFDAVGVTILATPTTTTFTYDNTGADVTEEAATGTVVLNGTDIAFNQPLIAAGTAGVSSWVITDGNA